MPIPKDMPLYDKIKKEIYKEYTKPSAYRSGAVIKAYKKAGGEFIDDGKEKKLKRWFKEDWKDINPNKTDGSYPVYRPTKRVSKETPLTVSEVDPKNLKKQAKLKQKIKGDANLPPFTAKAEKEEELVGGSVQQLVRDTVKDLKRVAKRKFKNTINDIKKVVKKREPGLLPPAVRKLLSQIGDEKINKLVVIRTPLSDFTRGLLSLISLNEYDNAVRKARYDKMFHLALFINDKYILDKQEVLKLVVSINAIKSDTEKMDVNFNNQNISLNEFVDKTKKLMGDIAFTSYNSRYNNCQDLIIASLKANDLLTDDLKNFIKQDADSVWKEIPTVSEKIANWLTDAGAVADKLIEGEGKAKRSITKYLTSGHGVKIQNKGNELIIRITQVQTGPEGQPSFGKENSTEVVSGSGLTPWKTYVSQNLKGKKFGSLSNVNIEIKRLAEEYRKIKSQSENKNE